MSQSYIGQIMLFAGDFAPKNFAFCDGSQLSIQQYTALYSLIGTLYGGDGRTSFNLPDLRGRAPVQQGQGAGLSAYSLGQQAGAENVTLALAQIPSHTHFANGFASVGSSASPAGNQWAEGPTSGGGNKPTPSPSQFTTGAANATMASNAILPTGGGQAHPNVQPVMGMNYIICIQGIFPQFN